MHLQEDNGHRNFQQKKLKLDREVDELLGLMKTFKRSHCRMGQTVKCIMGLTVRNCKGKLSEMLQYKVWKPGRLEPTVNCDSSEGSG